MIKRDDEFICKDLKQKINCNKYLYIFNFKVYQCTKTKKKGQEERERREKNPITFTLCEKYTFSLKMCVPNEKKNILKRFLNLYFVEIYFVFSCVPFARHHKKNALAFRKQLTCFSSKSIIFLN